MTEFTAFPNANEFRPPSGNTPGRILVVIHGSGETGVYRWEAEVLDYDDDTAVYWINEGIGFDDFFDSIDFPGEGVWVVSDITVTWNRGDGWSSDDSEEQHYGAIRPATTEEIKTGALD